MAQASDAVSVAVGCLFILFTIGLMIGLIVSLRALKHPECNRKCHLGFISFASGWSLYVLIVLATMRSGYRIEAAVAGLFLFGVLALTGVVTAILGLSELSREPGRTGKTPAILTLVFSGLILAAVVAMIGLGAASGFMRAREQRAATPFTGHGFSIHPPGKWVRIDPSRGGPTAVVGYAQSDPDAFLRVLVEPVHPTATDLGTVAERIKDQNRQGSPDLATAEEGEESINGQHGWKLVCEMTRNNVPMIYWYWLHLKEGRLYMVVISGPRTDKAKILSEGRKAFETFRLPPSK